MATRDEALEQIRVIARAHGLTAADVQSAFAESGAQRDQRAAGLLGRILAMLGGAFLFAGLGVFIALNWDVMNAAARIIITLGSGIAAFIMALTVAADERYNIAKTPLYLVAALLQPTGILVTLDEFSAGGDWHLAALLTAGIMTAQQAAVFWRKRDTVLLFTTIVFASWFFVVALDLLGAKDDFVYFVLGASIVLLCVGLEHTAHRALTPFWYCIGAIALFGGLFALLEDTLFELLFMVATCGGVFLSTYVRSRTLLCISTLALLAYISYFTSQHFIDSLGWPIVLILLGLILIGLSTAAMRIDRRYIAGKQQ
jgi:hypothetical protein